jgi:hypothetical protein
MERRHKFSGIALLSCFFIYSQDLKQDLFVCHADISQSTQQLFKQRIYAYHFLNGTYTGRDELLSFNGKKSGYDYVRTDRGRNTFYKERYVVTGIGNIIDLKERKILFDEKAKLVRISNDSAIFYTNDAFKGKFYSVYNFRTGQYEEVKNLLFKALLGKEIEFDKSGGPFKINYYPQGEPKVEVVSDAGYGQQHLKDGKGIPEPPVFWLNDSVFIYPYFNKEGTEISIQKVNIENQQTSVAGKVQLASGPVEAKFERQEDLAVLYCNGSQVHIELKNNQVFCPEFSREQYGFSYALKSDPKGRVIKYRSTEIGNFIFDTDNFAVSDNIVAVVKLLMVGDEAYQQGMQVWNSISKSWQKIESEDVIAILGWAKN